MLYFGRVGSLWGHCAFFGSSWGKKVITPNSDFVKPILAILVQKSLDWFKNTFSVQNKKYSPFLSQNDKG